MVTKVLSDLTFRLMLPGEEGVVCELVHHIFESDVAPFYNEKGRRSFRQYAEPEAMSARTASNHFVLVALMEGQMVGMVEMRRCCHLSLLFVRQAFQGRGIGALLVAKAVKRCRRVHPRLREVTVNASPNALAAYERMGFTPTGGEQEISGVRSIPMKKNLN